MKRFFQYQIYHLVGCLSIGVLLYFALAHFPPGEPRSGSPSARDLIIISYVFAAVHHGWVWFFWRMELYFGKISAWFGPAGFTIYRIGFVAFALIRLLLLIPVSYLTAATAELPRLLSIGLIVVTMPLIFWALYSVLFYFGLNRAFGADHFDPDYLRGELEKRGIFKYIPNSMYTVMFLLLYHPGLFWHSAPGLLLAAAHHALIWFHYFCTEKPDMREIYGFPEKVH